MAEERPRDQLQHYPAERARQGRIILRTRTQRIIFVAGLGALIVFALLIPLIFAA